MYRRKKYIIQDEQKKEIKYSEAEFKEFEPRLKFKPQLKPVFGGFETRLKFIKFGHRMYMEK